MICEPRRITIRPSKPGAQALKNRNIGETKAAAASRRMRQSTRKVNSINPEVHQLRPELLKEYEADYRALMKSFTNAQDILPDADYERFLAAARAQCFHQADPRMWHNTLMAYERARQAAQPPQAVRRWRQDFYNRPDGW